MSSDLQQMEQELAELQARVAAERVRVKGHTLDAIKAMLASGTLTADDLIALLPDAAPKRVRPPRTEGALPPKYRDPATGNTWAGRGAPPHWIKGRNFEDFLIKE